MCSRSIVSPPASAPCCAAWLRAHLRRGDRAPREGQARLPPIRGNRLLNGGEGWVLSGPMATSDATQSGDGAQQGGNGEGGNGATERRSRPQGDRVRRGQARPPGQGHLPHRPPEDAAHPPLRGARRRDVRQGQDRRLPPPLHRRGGDRRRRHPGAPRNGLPDVHLPRARPGHRARHPSQRGHGRAVRPRGRLLVRPRRLDAPLRLGQALPRRLRDRRRLAAAVGRRRARAPTTWTPRT